MPDLRTWLGEVEKLGQLMTVENVHWDLELSTLTEIINERSKTRPAVIFDRIKEYPHGYRVAANLVSSVERLALTLGMQWEYKIVALGLIVDATEQNQRERHARILNDLGREDWEAVAYIAQSSTVLLKGPAKASYR